VAAPVHGRGRRGTGASGGTAPRQAAPRGPAPSAVAALAAAVVLAGAGTAAATTVIKMLLGLVRPDAGEAMLLGRPAAEPAARARVGYLPELLRNQPWLSAAEVLALHVRLSGVGVLAVALLARPELVVLDEPTSALDPVGRVDVRDIVLASKSRGVAVLLNSHLIGEGERVCDRVVILDRGRVAASGTLAELLGQRELRLQLTDLSPAVEARLAATGDVERAGSWLTVALPADDDGAAVPDLVRDLVALGVGVHAVEPSRISLEERLLGILRTGEGGDR